VRDDEGNRECGKIGELDPAAAFTHQYHGRDVFFGPGSGATTLAIISTWVHSGFVEEKCKNYLVGFSLCKRCAGLPWVNREATVASNMLKRCQVRVHIPL
jgi:hypothetical protein